MPTPKKQEPAKVKAGWKTTEFILSTCAHWVSQSLADPEGITSADRILDHLLLGLGYGVGRLT